jgi:hypothetical protein
MFKHLRARLFLLRGEYKCECPRCLGKGELIERVDTTPLLAYAIGALPGLYARPTYRREVRTCWVCNGRGWRLARLGYPLYG